MPQPPTLSSEKSKSIAAQSTEGRGSGRLRVLDVIRREHEIARVDISKLTGFSPATVTAITTELLGAGLIEPTSASDKPQTTRRGRPREALKLRGAAKLIAGVKVAKDAITVLLVDFAGVDRGDFEFALPQSQCSADALSDQIIGAVDAACAQHGMRLSDVDTISIGLAGMVDGRSGYVHWSSSLTERNVNLGQRVTARAPCNVFIENDGNLIAKAEQLFGKGQNLSNFLVVTIEHGIGMGIVINGALYRGARGCGAEFGHTKVTPDGEICQCGQRGCLEAHTADYALLQKANAGGSCRYPDIAALSDAARAGNAEAAQILNEAGRYFAMGLANLVNVFDPELLIIANKAARPHPLCADAVLHDVKRQVVQVDTPMPPISVHVWGDLMWAKGAAAYGLERSAELSVRSLGKPEREMPLDP